MIIEERDYTIHTQFLAEYLKHHASVGLPLQIEHLGAPWGVFTTDIGEMGKVTTMWQYVDYADRSTRRMRLYADPRWPAYLELIKPMLSAMKSRVLVPTSYSPGRTSAA